MNRIASNLKHQDFITKAFAIATISESSPPSLARLHLHFSLDKDLHYRPPLGTSPSIRQVENEVFFSALDGGFDGFGCRWFARFDAW